MIPDWKYQNSKVLIVPYVSGSKSSPDGLLGHLYLRTKEDGLLDTVWAGLPGINFDKFVTQMASDRVALQIYYRQGEPLEILGYGFLYMMDGLPGERLAQAGFCFFKNCWGKHETHDCGWLGTAYWFEEINVNILYGASIIENWVSWNYARKFGWELVGVAPQFLRTDKGRVDGRIVYLKREKFLPLLENWRMRNTSE